MKQITELTDQDCIHCRTQEEWDGICELAGIKFKTAKWSDFKQNSIVFPTCGMYCTKDYAESKGYTIHPVSDFLTPTVSVLTEIGNYRVIRNGDEVIVMTGNTVVTLTPAVLECIVELYKLIKK